MESLYGKSVRTISGEELAARCADYREVVIDIGTGDGRFVEQMARHAGRFVIGIDACREQLREASRRVPTNAVFLIANAEKLPADLINLATQVTINFPWGSLLQGLIAGHEPLLDGLCRLMRPGADLEIRLNGGALAESGIALEDGAHRVSQVLRTRGFAVDQVAMMDQTALRACPTSWAKRLAFGRDPRAILLCGGRPTKRYQVEKPAYRVAVIDGLSSSS